MNRKSSPVSESAAGLLRTDAELSRRQLLVNTGRLGFGALAVSQVGWLAACGGDSGAADKSTGDSGSSDNSTDDLTIGWVVASTGAAVSTLQPLLINGQIALDEINAAGGILGRKLRQAKIDDAADPAKEPGVIRSLADKKATFVLGPTGSSQALASLASSTPAKMIQCAWGNNADLTDGVKYPYHYLPAYTTRQQAQAVLAFAFDQLGAKKVAILAENTAFGTQAAQFTVDGLKAQGKTAAASQIYPQDATSLETYVRKCRDSGADVLIPWVASVQAGALMFDAMQKLNWKPPVVGHNALFIKAIFDLVPASALEDVYGTYYKSLTYTDTEKPGQRQQDYAKKIMANEAAVGPAANVSAAPYYDFLYLLKNVIEDIKTFDVAKVKKALDGVQGYDGILGRVSFTADNHGGLGADALALGVVSSGNEPEAQGVFRRRAQGT